MKVVTAQAYVYLEIYHTKIAPQAPRFYLFFQDNFVVEGWLVHH